ncbi:MULTISPECIES: glycoside hydrolase family 25 protein [unclassified Mesorhizobium]|uniref:glycoside hydrolase family 25 protein n=1 Tax=Mesorhizobium sp. L2C089B000 TaxID=1287120 RepID=UPI0003D02D6F|nr:glycoside hydrolase family 25 protein [Mesorhizobium sp. L2C089B000]ESZ02113.1 hypothetical protein X736_31470 [Mesorhizobium sp. L2C089B000]
MSGIVRVWIFGMSVLFPIAMNSPSAAKSLECTYEGQTGVDGSRLIEINTEHSNYSYQMVASNPEDLEAEGSTSSDATFVELDGALAALVHVKGLMQAGEITTETPALTIFYAGADGKFVEVTDGAIAKGTCVAGNGEEAARQEAPSDTSDPFSAPWENSQNAIVLDRFKGNGIVWHKVKTDRRVAAVIHKATQGLGRDSAYATRKGEAKALGLKWGSYHLLTKSDVDRQISNYLQVVGNDTTETHAVDVECLSTSSDCQDGTFKVTFVQIESALRRMKSETGRFPLLYVNHSVAKELSRHWHGSTEFGGVPLWYARFKRHVTDFPEGPWHGYTLWQFSSEINCSAASCPYRVPGTDPDMDLNVYGGTVAALQAAWPLDH